MVAVWLINWLIDWWLFDCLGVWERRTGPYCGWSRLRLLPTSLDGRHHQIILFRVTLLKNFQRRHILIFFFTMELLTLYNILGMINDKIYLFHKYFATPLVFLLRGDVRFWITRRHTMNYPKKNRFQSVPIAALRLHKIQRENLVFKKSLCT